MTQPSFLVMHGALVRKALLIALVVMTVGAWSRWIARTRLVTVAMVSLAGWAAWLYAVDHWVPCRTHRLEMLHAGFRTVALAIRRVLF